MDVIFLILFEKEQNKIPDDIVRIQPTINIARIKVLDLKILDLWIIADLEFIGNKIINFLK